MLCTSIFLKYKTKVVNAVGGAPDIDFRTIQAIPLSLFSLNDRSAHEVFCH